MLNTLIAARQDSVSEFQASDDEGLCQTAAVAECCRRANANDGLVRRSLGCGTS